MVTVLKLGGSVITDKDRPETLDGEALAAAADAIAAALADGAVDDLVVVHGGGSFGHHHADEHGVTTDTGSRDAGEVMAVHGAVKTLNRFVLSRLHDRDVPALPVHPLSAASRDADAALSMPTDQVATMLDEGFVPVLHGDGVVHAGEGVTVVSGDELVTHLARRLAADRVGLCSTVPGVLDADGDVIPEIRAFEDAADALGASDSTDVTGGMAAKVRELLALGAPSYVFGPDALADFLAGDDVGTRIE
ncbi:isopentenyl phosphate kinase [Halobaculum sp. P14]|uniref:isopentenyl phosphate kinase n=1 Tax=Halobaculum sp. P14 TaxID=3421638 RepID=UPI003EBC4753